jgi:hypothetical protein
MMTWYFVTSVLVHASLTGCAEGVPHLGEFDSCAQQCPVLLQHAALPSVHA